MRNSSVGFVLITCNSDSLEEIVDQLNEIYIVKEIVVVDGLWDLVVRLESKDLDDIRETIRWKLRRMIGIESTLTLVEYMT